MNFLEKDLETIIWESPNECEARGLDFLQMHFFTLGKRYRQMQLGPYGIADLVNIYYSPHWEKMWVQVIECKKDKINADTYLQVKRYVSGVRQAIEQSDLPRCKDVHYTVVLIGAALDTNSPLSHVIRSDFNCRTYTYAYKVDGIHFTNCSEDWGYESYLEMPAFFDQTIRALDEHRLMREAVNKQHYLQNGNEDLPLLITADGILVNYQLLERFNFPE